MKRFRLPRTAKRAWFRRVVPALAAGLVLAAAVAGGWASAAGAQEASLRVVAVGDIHGDFDAFVAILQTAGLVNAKHDWSGGRAVLVQTGDFLDRGPQQREVMDLLMKLERQAARAGGRVEVLLGNHEVMNLFGDLRDAGPVFAQFTDRNSERRRQAAWKDYVGFATERARALGREDPQLTPADEQAWMEAHPPGFYEHREAFAPQGRYGKWLRSKSAVARVGDTLFLHGGISPPLAGWKIEDINTRLASELKTWDEFFAYLAHRKIILPIFTQSEVLAAVRAERDHLAALDQAAAAAAPPDSPPQLSEEEKQHRAALEEFLGIGSWFSINPDGPLWFRGYATWSDEEGAAAIEKILATHGARHVVVGHTPQQGSIRARFDGRVFLIDTGMLTQFYRGGRPSALEIRGSTFTGIYPDERVVVHRRTDTGRPGAGIRALPAAHAAAPVGEWGAADEVLAAVAQEAAATPAEQSARRRVWLDEKGEPLPFTSDDEVLEFLSTANIVSMRGIGKGINNPDKVVLEKDGIRAHAIFRSVDERRDVARLADGRLETNFRDSYLFECAAYQLARLLGMDNVPPVVRRRVRGRWGSLQLFIEQAFDEGLRVREKRLPPDPVKWNEQVYVMRFFDRLIYNTDRNLGNILIDPHWKLWMIDHTRAFRRHGALTDTELVIAIDRGVWQRLRTVSDEEIRAAVSPYLQRYEIQGLLQRRQKLIALIEQRIAELGEAEVLIDVYGHAAR